MSNIKEASLLAFRDELKKTASRLTGAGALGGLGVGAGAAVGSLIGGARSYQKAKDEGIDTGGAVAHGFLGGLSGAGKGALVGGGVGAGVGVLRPGLGMAAAEKFTHADNSLGSLARFGQRQVHGLTGHGDIKGLRGGSFDAEQGLSAAESALIDAAKSHHNELAKGPVPEHLLGRLEKNFASARTGHEEAGKMFDAATKAEQMGLSSIPGTLKSLATHPIDTLTTGLKSQYEGAGAAGKTLMGVGTALGAKQVYDEASTPGEDRGKRVGRAVGGVAGGLVFAPVMPIGASIAAGEATSRLGGAIGSIRRKKPVQASEISAGHLQHPADSPGAGSAPTEVIRTPAADNRPPADMVGS